MKFVEALKEMKKGIPMKLPSWGGYWCWDAEKETIMMHCRHQDSDKAKCSVLDIRETKRVEYTLMNVLSDEWIPANDENCTILGGVPSFNFGEALKYMKRGMKVARKGWNGKGMYLRYVDPYLDKTYKVTECEPIDGTLLPYIGMKTAQNGFVPWLASQTDMLAEDWVFVEEKA